MKNLLSAHLFLAARISFVLSLFVLLNCHAPVEGASRTSRESVAGKREGADPYRGWDYLAGRLRTDGIAEADLRKAFGDPRMPRHENIPFAVAPREHEGMYARFTTKKSLARAMRCLNEHASAFKRMEKATNVPRSVVAAILLIETQCGDYTGQSLIMNRLARMASLSEQANIEWNYERLHETDDSVTLNQVQKRAAYLDETFYPEVLALFKMGTREHADILSIVGSYGGAFGIPQFLPSTFLKYAIDGDNNGHIDLMTVDDAVWSVGRFLSAEGWNSKAPLSSNRKAIWQYNRSEPYIDAVLKVSILLQKQGIHHPA